MHTMDRFVKLALDGTSIERIVCKYSSRTNETKREHAINVSDVLLSCTKFLILPVS